MYPNKLSNNLGIGFNNMFARRNKRLLERNKILYFVMPNSPVETITNVTRFKCKSHNNKIQ